MNQVKFFDKLDNINLQIQNKRRTNTQNGMWSAPLEFLNGQFANNQNWGQGNNGWGQEGNWGNNQNNQFGGGNLFGQGLDQFNLGMALVTNESLWGNNLQGMDWVKEQMKRQAYQIVGCNKTGSLGLGGMGDLNDILHKQITFLEPSPALKRLQQLKKEGKQFYDDRFPPNQSSLCGEHGNISEWSSIQWKKLSQVAPNSLIFNDKVEPNDIKQGYLGDCYFLAGLAALAERPDRIFNLFLLRQSNSVKYFSVKMLYKGKWMTIDMDENIPTLYGKPAFSSSVGNQLWVILLEKAWAKMYTSYKRIEAGYPQQPLHDLTGAPIKQILMKQGGFNKQAQWQYLLMASQKQYSMVASSRPGSDRNKSQSGIVQGHAYTFLNCTVLNYNGGSQRIVQLRNPWGKGQFKGRWSDGDSNWQRVSPSELKRIGFTNNPNDGTFFMTYDAFIDEFRALTVAEINDNASYIYKSIKDKTNDGGYFKIEIIQSGYYSFHVDKTPERSFEDKLQDQYNYPQAQLDLARVNGNSCQKLESCVSARRTLFKGYQLTPGIYVAYVKISYDRKWEKQFDVNLAIYAEYACDIELAPRELAVMMTGNSNVKWNPAEHQQQKGSWNNLGNSSYQPGDSGWGNYNPNPNNNNNNNNNGGWGNNNNNGGWGNNNNNSGGGNDGWGDYWQNNNGGNNKPNPNPNNNNNNNNSNDGWGNYWNNGNNNQGGNQQHNNNQGSGGNDGWGDYWNKKGTENSWGQGQTQPQQNDGWGMGQQNNTNNANTWGNQHNQTYGQGGSNSWGSPGW